MKNALTENEKTLLNWLKGKEWAWSNLLRLQEKKQKEGLSLREEVEYGLFLESYYNYSNDAAMSIRACYKDLRDDEGVKPVWLKAIS